MARRKGRPDPPAAPTDLRIIGGQFRGRKLRYQPFRSGEDPVTRPMKHRVREAIFNLISAESGGRHAIDLFAGTGALGLEALSRGAIHATFIEKHVPTAKVIAENINALGVQDKATLLTTSAFLWAKQNAIDRAHSPGHGVQQQDQRAGSSPTPASDSVPVAPRLVFCSPPYDFYVDRRDEMLALIESIMDVTPRESILVVEADERFDFGALPDASKWNVRAYLPAVVGIWRKDGA